ncbi:hypothetical protein [Streptomyces sp. NRRL B-3648]|uniref:hypothetical protein n=1 Tax=Streptomyces sp. NRRL B-3648 TaxID=1519493 RepID=UPI0006ADA37C|nr:hypothetical protein [Streptomyces sp. NRRL B-3648]KOX00036.1 hypothetical protein ADL04_14225 [Streptomyces sp. NRRL B-3648]
MAARAVLGVLAAVRVPQVIGSFRTLFQGKERGAAFGRYGAVAGFASGVGLLLGGFLTDADPFGGALGVAVIGTVFSRGRGGGAGRGAVRGGALVVRAFAVLCAALPRRAVPEHEG